VNTARCLLAALTAAALLSLVGAPASGLPADGTASAGGRAAAAPPATPAPSAPDDPYFADQWALERMHAATLWDRAAGSPGVIVAVLDTGVDAGHEDLKGKVVDSVDLSNAPDAADRAGHGTHVAGVIAAGRDNGAGIAGLAPDSRLLNVKVAGDDGTCRASAVAAGIRWAADHGALVINVSLELRDSWPDLEAAVGYAWGRGALIVAAAGNDGDDAPRYPAAYLNCLAVTGTGPDDCLAPLANYGEWVDLAAPGRNILSTLPGNRYGYESGTSFAAAQVSGLAALLFTVVTDTNGDGRLNDEVRAALQHRAQPLAAFGTGHGLVDAALLLPR